MSTGRALPRVVLGTGPHKGAASTAPCGPRAGAAPLTRHLEVVVQRPGAGALRSLLEGSSKKAEAGAEIRMSVTGKDIYYSRSMEPFPG